MNKSILDFVLEDGQDLSRRLGAKDREKLGQYLTSVREIEKRIEHIEKFGWPKNPGLEVPVEHPEQYRDHLRLMFDLLAVAMETDSTRVATFMLAHDGSNRHFPELEIKDGHHELSHHGGNAEKLDKIAKIDRFYTEQFAYFLSVLDSKTDADGNSLLHNSNILYGAGLSDGHRHSHSNLPIVLAGHGGGTLKAGRHLKLPDRTPLSNLFLSMMDQISVPLESFADSSGRIAIT